MRTTQHQAPQRPSGLPPVRGVGPAALDIRTVPNRELCARFRAAMSIVADRTADRWTAEWTAALFEARALYREIELRLVPTNSDGSPRA